MVHTHFDDAQAAGVTDGPETGRSHRVTILSLAEGREG